MSDSDDELFLLEMQGVERLKTDRRVALHSSLEATPGQQARRRAAEARTAKDYNPLSGEYIQAVDPLAVLSYQRPGVQHGVFRNLRLAKYSIDARLDLHRLTVEQARRAVFEFLRDCLEHDIRCVLISHGKGEGRKPQPALLKSCIAQWLPQLDVVLAFHSALKQHGGVGATYVLLRKSEKKRQENRERHAAKRN